MRKENSTSLLSRHPRNVSEVLSDIGPQGRGPQDGRMASSLGVEENDSQVTILGLYALAFLQVIEDSLYRFHLLEALGYQRIVDGVVDSKASLDR